MFSRHSPTLPFVHRTGYLALRLVKVLRDARFETQRNFPILEEGFNENAVKRNPAINLRTETLVPFKSNVIMSPPSTTEKAGSPFYLMQAYLFNTIPAA